MGKTVGDFVVRRLYDWGIRQIYGYPGDGINGFMGALNRFDGEAHIRFIQARHEEEAAFMACGHAKFSGEVGVCMATSGPGAIHLLNGLYDAKKDHTPVVAIVGQQARTSLGAHYQQEIDLTTLYKDVAEYMQVASTAAQARHMVDEAVRTALADSTVTCIAFPNDLQEADMEAPPRKHGSTFSGVGYTKPRVLPADEDLQRAADALNAGYQPAMLVGAGVKNAVDEVFEVADLLGAGVAKALLAKWMVPDTHPMVTGSIGLLGTEPSDTMMRSCDTLLMVGTSFPYSEFLPEEDQVRAVQIDIEGKRLGLRFPTEVNLQGDSRETLRALIPLLKRKNNQEWRNTIQENIEEWWSVVEDRSMDTADPVNPQRVFWELSSRLPDNAIVTADSGSAANWYARQLKARPGMMGSLSGGLATMCPAVPYAIAAKFTHPDRPVFAMVGDGAMQMLGNAGLVTVAKYWQEWSNSQLIVCVLNNGDLNQVTWEQRVMEGDPKFNASQDIPDFPFDKYAENIGLIGLRMDKEKDITQVWDRALQADRPVVINAYTDPNVPPMPPHITFDQASKYMQSVLKGDPDAVAQVKQSLKAGASKYFAKIKKARGNGHHE